MERFNPSTCTCPAPLLLQRVVCVFYTGHLLVVTVEDDGVSVRVVFVAIQGSLTGMV